MKTKILMVSPPGYSPVRTYRGEGVMLNLPRLDSDIEILFPQFDEPWKDILRCDIVYCFRTFDERYRQIAEQALIMGKKVWFDLDDDIFHVRRSHPNFFGINNPQFQAIANWFLANADAATVTTNELKNTLMEAKNPVKACVVIPNALDDYHLDMAFPWWRGGAADLHWRGGASHQEDLLYFQRELSEIREKTGNLFTYHGYDPWFLENYGGHHQYVPEYFKYMSHLRDIHPGVVIVPLMDVPFNRCKSNIAALEAIWAGALVVVPEWIEWDFPGRYSYQNRAEFVEKTVSALAITTHERNAITKMSHDWLKANRVQSVVNIKRLEVIESLMS